MNSKYLLGDRLVADCLLPESHPPAILQWYINDVTADIKHLSRQFTITRNISQYYHHFFLVQCTASAEIYLYDFHTILRSDLQTC